MQIILKNVQENLKVLQTVYAVSIVLGFKELATVSFSILFSNNSGLFWGSYWILFIYVTITALLGFRLFWCVGNFTRFLYRHYQYSENFKELIGKKHFIYKIISNLIVLFLHSFVYFLLTRLLNSTESLISKDSFISLFRTFSALYCIVLLGNALWLYFLSRNKGGAESIEVKWATNNFASSLLLLVLLLFDCHLNSSSFAVVIFYFAIPFILIINTIYDLVGNGHVYIFHQQITFPSLDSDIKES